MHFLIAIIVTTALAYLCRKSIKKHATYYYLGALALALATVFLSTDFLPPVLEDIFSDYFRYGTIGTAMITLVMYLNAFVKAPKLQRTFMPIRGELSIISCILILGQNFYTGKTYLVMFIFEREKMSMLTMDALWTSIILVLIMLPLFITSFKSVRKKMKPANWKKLQKLAYVYYMGIYIHVIFLFTSLAKMGNSSYILNIVIYSIVFLGYGTLKLYKHYIKGHKKQAVAMLCAMYMIVAGYYVYETVEIDFNLLVGAQAEDEVNDEATGEEEEDLTPVVLAEGEIINSVGKTAAELVAYHAQYDIDLTAIPDGSYSGEAEGYSGIIYVTVTMEGGAITKITLDAHTDDQEYIDIATWVRKWIIDAQDIDVDVVTDCTYSCDGIKNAVLHALTTYDD